MKTARTLLSGAIAFAFLFLFGTPVAQAQLLDGTTHDAKMSSAAVAYVPMVGFVKEGGKASLPLILRSTGANPDTLGFDYDINMLIDTGPGADCGEAPVGTLSTYSGENEGVVNLDVSDFPGPGQTLLGRLFVKVKNTPGKSALKTVAGWTEVEDGVAPEPDGISKKAQLKASEKEEAKLVDCAIP